MFSYQSIMGWSALSPLSQETDLNMPESDWAITRLRWWSSWHLKPFMVFSLFPDEWCGLLILNILLDLGPTWSLSVFWCRLSQFWIWGSLECREHKFEKPGNTNSQNTAPVCSFSKSCQLGAVTASCVTSRALIFLPQRAKAITSSGELGLVLF